MDDIKGLSEFERNLGTVEALAPGRIIDQLDKEARLVLREYRKRVKNEAVSANEGKRKHLYKGMRKLPAVKNRGEYETPLANQYRSAPHYHLVEHGHHLVRNGRVVGFVDGKYYFKRTLVSLEPVVEARREKWAEKLYKELL